MIEVNVIERLIRAEQENNMLRNQQADQQATMEYLAMMADIDISTDTDDEVTNGGEAQ